MAQASLLKLAQAKACGYILSGAGLLKYAKTLPDITELIPLEPGEMVTLEFRHTRFLPSADWTTGKKIVRAL